MSRAETWRRPCPCFALATLLVLLQVAPALTHPTALLENYHGNRWRHAGIPCALSWQPDFGIRLYQPDSELGCQGRCHCNYSIFHKNWKWQSLVIAATLYAKRHVFKNTLTVVKCFRWFSFGFCAISTQAFSKINAYNYLEFSRCSGEDWIYKCWPAWPPYKAHQIS